jgi:glycerophosphoryl diester phosphodiesterase
VARRVAAHRGASDTLPENTIVALADAVELGCDFVEFDVRATRDGRLVLLHDATLDRTTDGHGALAARTLHELRALDAGAWLGSAHAGRKVPTLNETLAVLRDTAAFIVDFKEPAPALIEELVLSLRADDVLGKALVTAPHASTLETLASAYPDIRLAVPFAFAFPAGQPPQVARLHPKLLLARAAEATAGAAAAAHGAGLELLATLPRELDAQAAQALAKELESRGVDGIMTARARSFLASGLRMV